MKWFVCALLICCIRLVENYQCDEDKRCDGSDQCCNTASFFNLCCPRASTCCSNGPRVKCCGPLDVCCNDGRYRSAACCPSGYSCCGSGRYGGLRNSCCYSVPVWLWIIMGLSLSIILLMLLLSLVECVLEQRQEAGSNSGQHSYDAAYNTHTYPSDYGTTYPSYNSNDLYNEPRYYTTPPPAYTTPPPDSRGAANTRSGGDSSATRRRGGSNEEEEEEEEDVNNTRDSELSSFLNDTAGQDEMITTDLETSGYFDMSVGEEETDSSRDHVTVETQSHDVPMVTRDVTTADTAPEASGGGPLGNTWERYLRKKLKRFQEKRKKRPNVGLVGTPEDQLVCSPSEITLDSGIVDMGSGYHDDLVSGCHDDLASGCHDDSTSESDDSSFHCSSWEDEEDLRLGNEIVYELNTCLSRVPRLQTLVQNTRSDRHKHDAKPRQSDTQTPPPTYNDRH